MSGTLCILLDNKIIYLVIGLGLVGVQPIKPSEENIRHTFKSWGPAYEVTLDLKINKWSYPDEYGQILQFTEGGSCCNPGQRVPGLWTAKDQRQILVSFDSVRLIPYSMQIGKWYNIIISKKKEKVSCFYYNPKFGY